MDEDEKRFRHSELKQQRLSSALTVVIAALSFCVALVAVLVSVQQLKASTSQYEKSARESRYTDIVAGLGSSAAAVQTNSMRLLAEYAEDRNNFDSSESQDIAADDAIQTLMAFIEDQSSVRGFTGLADYESPQPIVLSRAAVVLMRLADERGLGSHAIDISRANLHGISLTGMIRPEGKIIARDTDFRRASLGFMNVSGVTADFSYSYFTCARLGAVKFGRANLLGADLSGADLSGADLSHVQNLTPGQLHGVTTGPKTRLPSGIHVSAADAWGVDSSTCHTLVDHMTGMQAGWGYLSTHPCPTTLRRARRMTFSPPFDGTRRDLATACAIRAGRRLPAAVPLAQRRTSDVVRIRLSRDRRQYVRVEVGGGIQRSRTTPAKGRQ